MICRRYFVSGRVQGVFFRASTRRQALKLGLQGYARNLPDGRVEVLAAGPASALSELEAWLLLGPPQARVDDLRMEEAAGPVADGFSVG